MPSCSRENISKKQKINFEEIKESFEKRGYILLSTEKDYKDIHSKLYYQCPKHPDKKLYITYDAIKQGIGCPYCAKNGKHNFEEVCKIYNDNDFEPLFSKEEYENGNVDTLFLVKCLRKNKETRVSINSVIQRGHTCKYCHSSKGEEKIIDFLKRNNITYIKEKTFDNCIYQNKLRFDFYLPDYNLCIEFQGEQHYNPDFFIAIRKDKEKGILDFTKNQIRDKIKRDFCKENKIDLLEISYKEEKNINFILSKYIQERK